MGLSGGSYTKKDGAEMRNIRFPRLRLPQFSFSVPRVPLPDLTIVLKILLGICTTILVVTGSLGLFISYIDTTKWIAPFLPIRIENILWTGAWLNVTENLVSNTVFFFNTYMLWTVGISILLIVVGFALHVHNFRTWWRNIKSAPMGVVRSPLRAYRRIAVWRDWLIGKITYLNDESAKWKTTFKIIMSPYSFLRMMGFSPQMAIGLLAVGSTAGTGVVVNETVFADKCFSCGDYGEYNAPNNRPIDKEYSDNTLQINLGAIPVREITIENVSVGTVFTGDAAGQKASTLPSGKAEAILISGNPQSSDPAFNATRIEIGTFIIEKSRCKSMDFSDVDAHTIVVEHNASDGQSIVQTSGNARNRAIGGGHHQAEAMTVSGGQYDRVWLDAGTSGVNGQIGTLTLSNVFTKGGTCTFKNLDIGVLKIRQNEIGHDTNLATKEFEIKSTVTGANWTVTDNVEITMAEPAVQLANP